MKYISAEQFLEQSKEVQKALMDWWKPSIGDLYAWVKRDDECDNNLRKMECCNSENIVQITSSFKGINEGNRIPLLTEGQLREFVEDKSGQIVEIDLCCGGYSIVTEHRECECEDLGDDLLEAYWQVACILAEEESKCK